MTDGQTDGRNCDSICALSIYAVARKNPARRATKLISNITHLSHLPYGLWAYDFCFVNDWTPKTEPVYIGTEKEYGEI